MKAIRKPLQPFNTIGQEEIAAAYRAIQGGPLSGFLGGRERGGKHVRALEDAWAERFGAKHVVACNSATSGLLAACMAAGVKAGDQVAVPCFTMSATAAAPALLGADIRFCDIEPETFALNEYPGKPTVLIVTSLFGHPAELGRWRKHCDAAGMILIEDNAQSIGATEDGRYAGTIGHMGCFSLNVHKHLQTGEGGIVTTDDDELARRLRQAINHGELSGGGVGLNLRMTEVEAAMALVQLGKLDEILAGRIRQAEAFIAIAERYPGITVPVVREGGKHVYYTVALRVAPDIRERFVELMNAEGVPLRAGYVEPLYRLPAFRRWARKCPVAEMLHDHEIVLFENCAWDIDAEQMEQVGESFEKVMDALWG